MYRLQRSDRFRDLEPFGKHVDHRCIDIVDALPISVKEVVSHARTLSPVERHIPAIDVTESLALCGSTLGKTQSSDS